MKKLLVILSAVILTACGGGGGSSTPSTPAAPSSPASQPAATTSTFNTCVSNANPTGFTKQFGSLLELSSVWNPAGATAYNVCLNNTLDANNNITDLEIVWNVTATVPASSTPVVMYPDLMFGWQPGFTSSTTTILPASVANVPSLPVEGTVTTTCNGACGYDTSFDLMFSKTATPNTWPPAAEVMVYLSDTFGNSFPGTNLGTVTIDGQAFTVYQNNVQINSNSSWPSLVYIAQNQPLTNLNGLNLKDFVQDALNRGVINTTLYLDMVELGSEVQNGSGTTSIKNFTIAK
jgi:hypothetical protein